MKSKLLRLIDKLIGPALRNHYQAPSMEWSLGNMRKLGFNPRFIVDIGAFQGEWTAMAKTEFPHASVLMLEAQESKRPALEAIKTASRGDIDYRISVMGSTEGESIFFNEYDHAPTACSVLVDHAAAATRKIERSLSTLDSILAEGAFPNPNFIKLDVQGYEIEVLKGAREAMQSAEVILMEVSIIDLYQGNPLLHDVLAFMTDYGFKTYDICSLLRRPLDHALCQMDVIFVKEMSRLCQHKTWN